MIELGTITALVVEANPNMRTQLRNMLNMAGITKVQFAVTAGVAIRKLRDSIYDLILCEYHIGDGQDGQRRTQQERQGTRRARVTTTPGIRQRQQCGHQHQHCERTQSLGHHQQGRGTES